MCIGIIKMCSDVLNVQETDSRVSQQCRIKNENEKYTSIVSVGWCFRNIFVLRC